MRPSGDDDGGGSGESGDGRVAPKEAVVAELRRRVHHHESIGTADVRVEPAAGRRVALVPVDCGKYALRSGLVDDFEAEVRGHTVALVVEQFTVGRVECSIVDTTAHEATVRAFLAERARRGAVPLEDYESLSLAHVEALERWGAVGRVGDLDARHIHDAFLEHPRTEGCEPLDFGD